LAAFLGVDAGVRARRVNEGEHGAAEFCGELHDAESFAIAFGLGLAKVANDALLGVSSLLLADDGDGTAAELAHASDEGFVIAEVAIAVKFDEVCDHQVDPVQRMRTLRVPGDLGSLPRTKMRIKLAAKFEDFVLEALEFGVAVYSAAGKTA